MTTICSFDCNQSAIKSLIGDRKPMAPVDGTWMKVSPRVFEEQVRKLAYGLMVKDYRRGQTIVFTGCSDDMKTFINTACSLAHLKAEFSESAEVCPVACCSLRLTFCSNMILRTDMPSLIVYSPADGTKL